MPNKVVVVVVVICLFLVIKQGFFHAFYQMLLNWLNTNTPCTNNNFNIGLGLLSFFTFTLF